MPPSPILPVQEGPGPLPSPRHQHASSQTSFASLSLECPADEAISPHRPQPGSEAVPHSPHTPGRGLGIQTRLPASLEAETKPCRDCQIRQIKTQNTKFNLNFR